MHSVPVWVWFLGTMGLVALALEAGFFLGKRKRLRVEGKSEVSGSMVGATLGLLAFMLAFTFNGAASRHDVRKALVLEEANAIDKAWLRAGFLAEPDRSAARAELREYVAVRVDAANGKLSLPEAARRSEELHASLWAHAEAAGRAAPGSIPAGLFVSAVNEVIDVHAKRLTIGVRTRIPPTIWVTLYLLMTIGMFMMGTQIGLSGARHIGMELALALSFSTVLFVIADLDQPQAGLINVSQQAMIELGARMDGH
jgi:hypothetical protein